MSTSSFKPRINIAPNPVKDVIKLNIYSLTSGNIQIMLSDNIGKVMRTLTSAVQKGSNTVTTADLENWPSGIYTLKAVLGSSVFIKRILITK